MAGVGTLVAFAAAWFLARRDGLTGVSAFSTLGMVAVSAVAGARLWAFIEWWSADRTAHWIWNPFEPAGYSTPGGIVGGGAALLVARFAFGRREFQQVADAVVPAALVALAFARLGCLFEGCDIGTQTSGFGVTYPPAHEVVHPFGAYLALATLVVVVGASVPRLAPGLRAVLAASTYAAVRFVLEFFRADPVVPGLGQGVAVALLLVAIGWWWLDGRAEPRSTG